MVRSWIVCAIFESQMIFRIIVAVFVVIAIHLEMKYSKCLQCHEHSVYTNPFSKNFEFVKNASISNSFM